MIEKLGKFWTGAIAYVALFAGAGLSVAGNVADTFRTRGTAVDDLDLIMASAWPILVLLAIHLFVNPRWSADLGFQIIRWGGVAGVGVLAMVVSWTHLHDLMATRGQGLLVSVAGPVAIDLMAIMATGLILSMQTVATRTSFPPLTANLDEMTTEQRLANLDAGIDVDANTSWLARLDAELDNSTTAAFPVDIMPVSPAPSSNVVKPESVPADAADLIMAWATSDEDSRPRPGRADEAVAAAMDVTARTARRWRYAITRN